jgi:hypothetical protein
VPIATDAPQQMASLFDHLIGAVKQSCLKEKGSNATQSIIDACGIKEKPHKPKPDEPVHPVIHTAICLE